jgi:VIT1/CCC1 family predicted Fe2+/Mn2+ transporter
LGLAIHIRGLARDDTRPSSSSTALLSAPTSIAIEINPYEGLEMSRLSHSEIHMVHRIGWLRAAVLGANDGIVSTSSLVVGVAAAGSGSAEILIAGLAGLVAGAMSMAAGEYVSVSSQTDAENADLARERRELAETPEAELEELTQIYVDRGLDRELAERVAVQLTERDALGTHARDELGISETVAARPVQAALVSALTFASGAVVPVLVALASPADRTSVVVAASTILALAILGGLGATAGGAGVVRGAARVTLWGALAMGVTAAVGTLFGVSAG